MQRNHFTVIDSPTERGKYAQNISVGAHRTIRRAFVVPTEPSEILIGRREGGVLAY